MGCSFFNTKVLFRTDLLLQSCFLGLCLDFVLAFGLHDEQRKAMRLNQSQNNQIWLFFFLFLWSAVQLLHGIYQLIYKHDKLNVALLFASFASFTCASGRFPLLLFWCDVVGLGLPPCEICIIAISTSTSETMKLIYLRSLRRKNSSRIYSKIKTFPKLQNALQKFCNVYFVYTMLNVVFWPRASGNGSCVFLG